MALIKCPECGKEKVSDTAMSCPECGFNIHNYVMKQKQVNNIKINKNNCKTSNKSNKIIYATIIILGAIAAFVVSFAIGYYKYSEENNNTKNSKIDVSNGNIQKGNNDSEPKKYTKKELTDGIKEYIDENYSEQLSYDIDEYDDTMIITPKDDFVGSVLALENACYLVCQPYMRVTNIGAEGKLIISIQVLYGSNNFLDYYFGSVPFVVLADDGTRETFTLSNYETSDDDEGHYYTNFYATLNYNETTKTFDDSNLDKMKELFSKSGLTCKLNKENNNNYCITGELEDKFSNGVITMIDMYNNIKASMNFEN